MPITPTHRSITAVIGVGLLFDTFENNLSGTIAKVLQDDFAFGATELKLVLASAFIGQFIGSLLLGKIADRYGRRRAFLINLAIYSGFSLLGAFSPNAAWLIVTRFFAGVGIGAEQSLSDCYLSDVLPAKKRGRFIAWAYTLAFCGVPAVGFAALWLVPLSPLGIDGWRWLFVIGALGSAVVWVLRRKLIESPRWLATAGREDEADALVSRMEAEVPEGAAVAYRAEVEAEVAAAEKAAAEAPATRLRDIFQPRLRRRTVMLWIFCALSVVGYYGFGTLAPQILAAKGYGIVAGLGFTAVCFLGYPVGSALSLPIIDRMERKRLVALSAAAMVVAGLGFSFAGSAAWIMVFGFVYTVFSNVFSSVSHVYLAEQYPTAIRAAASGAAYSLSKLSAAALPFVLLPVLTSYGPGALFGVIAAVMTALAVTVLTLGDRTTGVSVDRAPTG
ncbi:MULTISPECIES: MFS transporter [unclassified Streptomyces]|uniref:MFS transporter n=1 Tax=unclassified Streptomyces TaxID=2593676 RepID=UPI0007460F71|nr:MULTISPECIES: MFS transporter [unclassified Streptomyces]KUL50183.1 MFS transporter [Streptomyces sp. NRRL S-1521]